MDSSLDSDVVSASPVPCLNSTPSQFLPQDALHTLSCKLQNSRGFSRWHCQDQTSTFQTSSHNTQSAGRYGPCLLESPFQGLAPIILGSHRKKNCFCVSPHIAPFLSLTHHSGLNASNTISTKLFHPSTIELTTPSLPSLGHFTIFLLHLFFLHVSSLVRCWTNWGHIPCLISTVWPVPDIELGSEKWLHKCLDR